MGKIYTYVFMSDIATINSTVTSQEKFFVDWSQMPDMKYKVTFVFASSTPATQLDNNDPANVFVDLGQGSTTTIVGGQNSSQQTFGSSFLGVVVPQILVLGAGAVPVYASYLCANTTTNNPIYLLGRPRNNNVQIQIIELITSANPSGSYYAPYSGAYTMTINFEEDSGVPSS